MWGGGQFSSRPPPLYLMNGLQKCLDKLHRYCIKWHLSVNIDKTKCMLLSLGNAKMKSFMFGEKILENVQTYKYLGVILHKNGKFSAAILDRISKTKHALHVVKQILGYSSNAPVKLAMPLFDKQLSPILLYGSSVWSIPDCSRHIHIHVNNIEAKVKEQVKQIIYDRLKRNVIIDETRAFRDKNKILVKLNLISDKLDLLYQSNNTSVCAITDHATNKDNAIEAPFISFHFISFVGVPPFI